ncbi:MAG: amidohydrolase family protein [Acidobacteria bacterium]|nr:amidohydrolase family protein [Acidobacteriota bacterium]
MYHDHHFHPFGYVSLLRGLELMSAADLSEVLARVENHAGQVEGPIIGQRLNDETVTELRLPTAADIDDVVADRPVLLYRYCGHIAVANNAALALAGVDADTADPRSGSFDRDSSGRPNGILRETAVGVVSRALAPQVPAPSDFEIIDALAGLTEMGIGSVTGIISTGEPVWCGVGNEVETLARLAPDLPIDMDVLVIAETGADLVKAKKRIDRAEGRIRFHGWKDFSDGSLGGHTAAMYEPFSDRPDTRGIDRLNRQRAVEMGQTSLDLGGVVAIHAIGDRANDSVLDVFEDLIRNGADATSLRVEHASILTNSAIDRMADLGVTASVQPAFLASEETWLVKRLGNDRMSRAYPFRSLEEAGVTLLGGSDSPVELPDPATGIHAAVDRHGINTSEALSREAAEALFSPPD